MAIQLDGSRLTSYVEEHKLPLIQKAVLGSRSTKELNLMTGVKGDTALNLLDTTVNFGNGYACGFENNSTSTLSQRVLKPGYIKVNESFCDKTLLKSWANYEVRIAAGQKTLPFEEDFVEGVLRGIGAKLEKMIWQGDAEKVSAADNFDGLIKVIDAAGTALDYTYAEGDSISSIVNGVYNKIPTEVFEKGDVVIYVGADWYRKYIQELIANGNLVITTGLNDVALPESVLVPGTNLRVIPLAGLDGSGRAFASYKDNFIYGTDLAGDEEKFDLWYSKDNQEFRLAVEFVAGVQVAYPDQIATAKKGE